MLKFLFGGCIVSEIDLFHSKSATQWATNHCWNCCWHTRTRKDNQGFRNGQQDQNTFSAVFFPKQWYQRRCLSQFVLIFCAHFFWCSTHNFDFFVINDVGGYCPLDSVQDFSSVFRFFVFSFPPPVFHCCAGGQDISCTVFAQSEIAKDSFCACLQFPPNAHCFQLYPAKHFDQRSGFLFLWLQLHCPTSKLLTGQDFFCHFGLNPICWLIAVRVRTKIAIFWKSFSNICHTSDNNSTPS